MDMIDNNNSNLCLSLRLIHINHISPIPMVTSHYVDQRTMDADRWISSNFRYNNIQITVLVFVYMDVTWNDTDREAVDDRSLARRADQTPCLGVIQGVGKPYRLAIETDCIEGSG